jgi:hypothetical protein
VHDAAAVVREHDEHEQQAAGQCRYREKIHRREGRDVVGEARPRLWDGGRDSCASSRDTVPSEISIPSLRSSPCMRGAPHNGLPDAVSAVTAKLVIQGWTISSVASTV